MQTQMIHQLYWRQWHRWAIICCILSVMSTLGARANTNLTFTLPIGQKSYRTSAAVYSDAGVMVRQLWKYVSYAPGEHTVVWDDLDDEGKPVPVAAYTIKVLYHNMDYIWDGVVGNSSQEKSGYAVQRNNGFITGMAIAGTTAMYACGNFEGPRDFTTFTTTNPRAATQKIAWLGAHLGTPRCAQIPGADGKTSVPVIAKLNLNFAAGATGKVHIIWGGFTVNSQGGAQLTVTDNTTGTSFTSKDHPELAFKMGYGGPDTSCHTIIKVGSSRQLTISVADNNDWNNLGHAFLQAVWVEDGDGTAATTYDSTTADNTFDRFSPPTVAIENCVIGGTWLLQGERAPIFSTTRSARAGFSVSCPAVGGTTQACINLDFSRAGLIEDGENIYNWNTNVGLNYYVATDGVWFYGASPASYDPATEKAGLITPMWVDNGKQAYFTHGKPQKPYNGYSYNFIPNAIRVGTQSGLSGIAVQTKGNILAASVAPDNKVYLFDKRSGDPLGTIAVPGPGHLAMTPAGDLWVLTGTSAVRYTALSTQPVVATTIDGLSQPMAVAVSPVAGDDTVIIADGGTNMQLLAYTNSGKAKWTYGQQGGYQTHGAAVTNDKLWFSNPTFITYQPDGSFWVGDGENSRALHLSADRRTVLDELTFQGMDYCASVDVNNPTRVFNSYKEFRVDYSKPLAPDNGSWSLVNNWKAGLDPKYWQGGFINGVVQVVTFPKNGRTYALLPRNDLWCKREICELTATGVRPTGVLVDGRWTNLEANGALTFCPNVQNVWQRQDLTGFDDKGNPQYGEAYEVASAPTTSTGPSASGAFAETSTKVFVAYDTGKDMRFHLGGVRTGTKSWLWRAFPAVTSAAYEAGQNFGDYDIGDGITYPAEKVITAGRQIVCDFHGEFWKQAQSGQFMHFLDNGLFVGQYGTAGKQPDSSYWPAGYVVPGWAGNGFSVQFATVDNALYMWVNDESQHGPQRWHLSGLNTINVLDGHGTPGDTIAVNTLEVKEVVATPTITTTLRSKALTINCATVGATIRYTTDGSMPDEMHGTLYTTPVTILKDQTLRAIAFKIEMNDSAVVSTVLGK